MFTLLRCSKVREPSVIDTLWLKSKGLGQPVRESALGAAGRQHGRAAAVWTESECEHLDLGMAGMHATYSFVSFASSLKRGNQGSDGASSTREYSRHQWQAHDMLP